MERSDPMSSDLESAAADLIIYAVVGDTARVHERAARMSAEDRVRLAEALELANSALTAAALNALAGRRPRPTVREQVTADVDRWATSAARDRLLRGFSDGGAEPGEPER